MSPPRGLCGEVWLVRLDPTEGREIRKTRPCAIVSPDSMNRHIGTLIIMPITSGSRLTPFRVQVNFRRVPGLLLGDQIRCVSAGRLIRRLGKLDHAALARARAVLRQIFEDR